MNRLNKTAVVTGISSGIGLALTKKLLNEGYNVIGTTRSGVLKELSHPDLQIIALEATDRQSSQQAVERILTLTGGIDLLINNAGAAPDVFAVEPEYQSFTQTLNTNITGAVFFTEPLLEHINEGGQIIFISSNMGLPENAAPNGPGYRLSKAAINMYAAMLATRLADSSIRVMPVHPGWVQTKLGGDQAPLTPEQSAEGIYQGILTGTQSGKLWDITAAVN
ncbi:NAD(P)-dependent dehydrogenase, short-chain alcohol dehydrogenase family [Chitinophaga rupis]|uniref:NAD(P)-dependent dehydrogenase, short-chain alcohol dehydrogenase family n=1 Tax=Chitinophaga rupis TaxID=573321 RepID=A0A1H8G9D1_9BACT|nr:SDR family NAD(P)-dependent oxidoreductase [Chitinophaga rupis]SEN40593.1 NAD(P)-dependent dehydrogenase, short-chain alcohol dehydrogenase family [Chitinophaga rupis]